MSFVASDLEEQIRTHAFRNAERRVADLEARLQPALGSGKSQSETEPVCCNNGVEYELDYLERLCATDSTGHCDVTSAQVADLRRNVRMASTRAEDCGSGIATPLAIAENVPASVGALANFLRPARDPSSVHSGRQQDEDNVRLLAAEGRLGEELGRFPVLAVPGTQSALVLRSSGVQSWTTADDEAEMEQERLAILELSQAAANLRDMYEYIAETVENDQVQLDSVEQQVATSMNNTGEAVVLLNNASASETKLVKFIGPSVLAVILGVGTVSVGVAAAAGCVGCVLVRGVLTTVVFNLTRFGTNRLSQWQQRALQSMTQQLPRACQPLSARDAESIIVAADEAERRLVSKLGDVDSWTPYWPSFKGFITGFTPRHRPSDVRKDGYAWSIAFEITVSAREAFRTIQTLNLSGRLHPGCEVSLSRPVDGVEGTFVRYIVYSKWFAKGYFYGVSRHARTAFSGAREKYVLALSSLLPELLDGTGLPDNVHDADEAQQGLIHTAGIMVTDVSDQNSLVEVMGDIDMPTNLGAHFLNAQIRNYVSEIALLLRRELQPRR